MRRLDMALGHGSKWHLLRYLGYHRDELNRQVERRTGARVLRWLDFPFEATRRLKDDEWKGLDFLPDELPAKSAWRDFWPQTGNVPNWDAVGQAQCGEQTEWLLVEAKAHVEEMHSECTAKKAGGLDRIRAAFGEAMREYGSQVPVDNWLRPYYQHCNRLAVLYFLVKQCVPARLVFIYFLGDDVPRKTCPSEEDAWDDVLGPMREHIGLTGQSELESRVHTVFLPVCP